MKFDIVTILTIVAVIVILFVLFKIFKLLTRIILIAAFLAIAFFTNPSEEKHQLAAQEKAKAENIRLKANDVIRKDLKVASLTQIKKEDGVKTVGVGLFFKVIIFRDPE